MLFVIPKLYIQEGKIIISLHQIFKSFVFYLYYKNLENFNKLADIVLTPITGIDEAKQEDEQSPDPRSKKMLPSIEEETKNYIFPK